MREREIERQGAEVCSEDRPESDGVCLEVRYTSSKALTEADHMSARYEEVQLTERSFFFSELKSWQRPAEP